MKPEGEARCERGRGRRRRGLRPRTKPRPSVATPPARAPALAHARVGAHAVPSHEGDNWSRLTPHRQHRLPRTTGGRLRRREACVSGCVAKPPNQRFHDRKALKAFRRKLRSNGTSAEAALWTLIKTKRLAGRRFRRQHSIGKYVLDFYCPSERLAIELDGASHMSDGRYQADMERDAWLQSIGIRVLRFENRLVFDATEQVLEMIEAQFRRPAPFA